MSETTTPSLPGWDEMTDLDKGAVLLYLASRDARLRAADEGDDGSPLARYFDHPALTVLSPAAASAHAARLEDQADRVDEEDYYRLHELASEASRSRWEAEHPEEVAAQKARVRAVLDQPLEENDSGALTVRGYLAALLAQLWAEGEGFSGKRPFGNSGWQGDFDAALIKAGFVAGELDEDGYADEVDDEAVDALILAAIKALGDGR